MLLQLKYMVSQNLGEGTILSANSRELAQFLQGIAKIRGLFFDFEKTMNLNIANEI